MSNIEYDLDVSGGLMPQVQALIAPPVSDEASKNKKQEKVTVHPYFKRPGKGHNHDSCDACSEGGDLICCDKCPASFHLTCHDPPLDEKDIPTGQWLCHHCRKTKELATEKNPQMRNKRSNSSTGSNSSSGGCPTKIKKPKPNPMEVLVKAASMLNPRQFELPKHMCTPCVFPGTDKVENLYVGSRGGRSKGGGGGHSGSGGGSSTKTTKNKSHELHNGLVPLPVRTCFECRRSCRIGPLVVCDYCPLLFHLDCLDPPLTALPAGRWMCPNHVEQYIDSKLVTSVSATERIRLWDKFNGPVDQDAVKTEFFRKVHCKNPPFRVKVRLATRKKVTVPPMVRHHYKNPVPLLPSLRDVLRLETVANRGREYLDYIALQAAHASHLAANANTNTNNNETATAAPSTESVNKVNGQMLELCNGQAPTTPTLPPPPPPPTTTSSSTTTTTTISNTDGESFSVTVNGLVKQEIKNESGVVNGTCNGTNTTATTTTTNTTTKLPDVTGLALHTDIERELKQLDDRLIRLLAYQRIQHLLSQHDDGHNPQSLATLIANSLQNFQLEQLKQRATRHMPLPSELLTAADIDRIARIFTSPKRVRARSRQSTLRARAMLCPVVSKHFYNVRTSEVDPTNVRHDASFMGFRPTVSARFPEAAAMRYRSLTIGRGSSNDVELERFGHCNFTSPKHAVIFYDECTKHYELINYSEYGTQVNNVLYSCDFSDKSSNRKSEDDGGGSTSTNRPNEVVTKIREIIDRKRRVHRPKRAANHGARMTAAADSFDNLSCSCGATQPAIVVADPETAGSYSSASAGWEGAAILSHGALLRFGCVTFVFSIVDCATV